jgi:hypothetical protein
MGEHEMPEKSLYLVFGLVSSGRSPPQRNTSVLYFAYSWMIFVSCHALASSVAGFAPVNYHGSLKFAVTDILAERDYGRDFASPQNDRRTHRQRPAIQYFS